MAYLKGLTLEEYESEFENQSSDEDDEIKIDFEKCIIKHDCTLDEYRTKHNLTSQDDVFNEILSDWNKETNKK